MITANDAREMVKANDIMPKLERRIEKAAKSCHTSTSAWIPEGIQDSIISRLTENGFSVTVIEHMVDCDNEIEICISWEEETSEVHNESDRNKDLEQQHKSIDDLAEDIMEHEKQQEEFDKFMQDGLNNFNRKMNRLRKLKEE